MKPPNYFYFNLIISLHLVVGLGLLKSCLMALAKTLVLRYYAITLLHCFFW